MLLQNPNDNLLYASLDECGYGALMGPVVTACVVWKPGDLDHMINDSKQLSPIMRWTLSEYIKENAIDYSITFIDNTVIDSINVLNANMKAMHKCLDKLNICIDSILVDGHRFKQYKNIPHTCVVKGDATYVSIAAASILAKVARDEYIKTLHEKHPQYNWDQNMGYGTKQHIYAINKHGPSTLHRLTFLRNNKLFQTPWPH